MEVRERQLEVEADRLRRMIEQRERELEGKLEEEREARRREIVQTKQMLDEERRRLESEHRERELRLVREQEALQRQREQMEAAGAVVYTPSTRRSQEEGEKEAGKENEKAGEKRERKKEETEQFASDVIERADLEEEFLCVICHSMMVSAMTIECAHSFCSSCLEKWMAQKQACPSSPICSGFSISSPCV